MDDDTTLVFVWGAWSENMMCPVPHVTKSDLRVTSDTPIEIQTLIPVDTLTFIIDKQQRLWVWGFDTDGGRLGLGKGIDHAPKPTQVHLVPENSKELSEKGKVLQISVGDSHVLALTTSGDVYSWGENNHNQLGRTSTKDDQYTPLKVQVGGSKNIKATQVLSVNYSSFAVCEEEVYAWGYNEEGNLGLNNLIPTELPNKITSFGDHSIKMLIENGKRVYAIVKPNDAEEDFDSDEEHDVEERHLVEEVKAPVTEVSLAKGPSSVNTSFMNRSSSRKSIDGQAQSKMEGILKTYNRYFENISTLHKSLISFDERVDERIFKDDVKNSFNFKNKISVLHRYAESIYKYAEDLEIVDGNCDSQAKVSIQTELKMLRECLTLRKVFLLFAQFAPYFESLNLNSFKVKYEEFKRRDLNIENSLTENDIFDFCRYSGYKIINKMQSLSTEFTTLHYGEGEFFAYVFESLMFNLRKYIEFWDQINTYEFERIISAKEIQSMSQATGHANEIWKSIKNLQGARLDKLKKQFSMSTSFSTFDEYCIDLFHKSDERIRIVEAGLTKTFKTHGKKFNEIIMKLYRVSVDNIELMKLANEASRQALNAKGAPSVS
jgi:hypothetical protein